MLKRFSKLCAVACLMALSACSSDRLVGGCPQVAYLRDLSVASDYGREAAVPENLVSVAMMNGIDGSCRYKDDGVNVDFKILMRAEKGPRLGGNQVSFSYFVSVLNPDDSILAKDIMTVSFAFPENGKMKEAVQDLHIFIPLAKDQDAVNYRVLTGFQLTESQLNLARENLNILGKAAP